MSPPPTTAGITPVASDDAHARTLGQPLGNTHGLPYRELVLLLAALMALNAVAIDVFVPALQDIGAALAVEDVNRRQLVISAYLIGFGGAQIFYGPLSDRFGRRPILFAGLGIYIAAAFAAIFAPTFEILLWLRALEGVGAAATRVMAVSIARDCFAGRQMAKVMSLVMTVFLVMPIFAPNVGALIMVFGNWQELSLAVFAFGVVVLVWSAIRLPETLAPANRRSLRPGPVLEAFRLVVTQRVSLCYTVGTMLIFGVLFGFISQAEQVYTGTYGLGATFTLYFSLVAVFMSLSSFTNSRLVERFGMRRLSHGALVGFAALGTVHLALAWFLDGVPPFWLFLGLLIPTFCLFGFIATNFNALAMDPLGHVAGTASSVLGSLQTLGGGIIGGVLGYAYDGTVLPLLAGFVILSLASLACTLVAERGRLFGHA